MKYKNVFVVVRIGRKLLVYVPYCIITVIVILPFLWMVLTSFKTHSQVMIFPPKWIPDPFVFTNYSEALSAAPFGLFFVNSFKICISVTIGLIFISSLGGYAFARYNFPGATIAFGFLMLTMMIPEATMLIPLYKMFMGLGWLNTHWSLIIPPIFANTFGTFLFRQFFLTVPKELEDAARMDGAGEFRIYWQIMMPLARAVIVTLALLVFLGNWNAFIRPLIFIDSVEKMTVTLGLQFFHGQFVSYQNLTMAATTIAIIPIIGLYVFIQRYLVRGVVLSGLKF